MRQKYTESVTDTCDLAVSDPVIIKSRKHGNIAGHIARKARKYAIVVAENGREFRAPWFCLSLNKQGSRLRVLDTVSKAKFQFRPGDVVTFRHDGRVTQGEITAFGTKNAQVLANDSTAYAVDYRRMTLFEPSLCRDDASELNEFALLAEHLIAQHGLCFWSFQYDNAKRRAGQCNFTDRIISMSHLFCVAASPSERKNTLLHEIAHALVGPDHHHDRVWKETALRIGCTGDRCHSVRFAPPRYLVSCRRCGWKQPRQTKRRNVCCITCNTPVTYQACSGTSPEK